MVPGSAKEISLLCILRQEFSQKVQCGVRIFQKPYARCAARHKICNNKSTGLPVIAPISPKTRFAARKRSCININIPIIYPSISMKRLVHTVITAINQRQKDTHIGDSISHHDHASIPTNLAAIIRPTTIQIDLTILVITSSHAVPICN